MNSALNRLPCGFLSFDDDGTILFANDRLVEILGRPREEVEGMPFASILAPGGAVFYQTHFFPMLRMHGAAEEIYLVLRLHDGGLLPMLAYAARGEVNDCLFISVTRREAYQNEVARARERLMGVLGHDLRVPLTSVMLGAETLLLRETLSDAGQRLALSMLASARRAARMTTDLLDFARARFAGGIPVQRQPIDLRIVAEKVTAELRSIHSAAAIELCVQGNCGGAWDADRAAQVVANLIGNALEHRRPNTPVVARLEGRGDEVALEVRNVADAAPPGDPFAPFEQRRGSSGLGLGLFIVREVMQAHGGSVSAAFEEGEFRVRALWPRRG